MKNPSALKPPFYYLAAIPVIIAVNYYSAVSFYFRYDTFVWLDKTIFDPMNFSYFFSYNKASAYFTPAGNLLFFLLFKMFKLAATPYHVFLILIHIFNSIIVYRLICRITRNAPAAFAASVMFGISPAGVEPVVYIAALHHSLATAFVLSGFLSFMNFKEGRGRKYYLLAFLFYLSGLLTKQTSIIMPALLLIYEWLKEKKGFRRKELAKYLPFFLASAIYMMTNKAVAEANIAYSGIQAMYYQPGGHIFLKYLSYLKFMLLPFDAISGLLRGETGISLDTLYASAKNILFVCFIIIFYFRWRKSKDAVFFLIWATVCLFPVLPFKFSAQSRYAYLPSIGFYAALAVVLCQAEELKKRSRRFAVLGLIIIYCCASQAVLNIYRSDYAFWKGLTSAAGKYCPAALSSGPARLYIMDFPRLAVSRDDEIGSAMRVALNNPLLEVKAIYSAQKAAINKDNRTCFLKYRYRRLWPASE